MESRGCIRPNPTESNRFAETRGTVSHSRGSVPQSRDPWRRFDRPFRQAPRQTLGLEPAETAQGPEACRGTQGPEHAEGQRGPRTLRHKGVHVRNGNSGVGSYRIRLNPGGSGRNQSTGSAFARRMAGRRLALGQFGIGLPPDPEWAPGKNGSMVFHIGFLGWWLRCSVAGGFGLHAVSAGARCMADRRVRFEAISRHPPPQILLFPGPSALLVHASALPLRKHYGRKAADCHAKSEVMLKIATGGTAFVRGALRISAHAYASAMARKARLMAALMSDCTTPGSIPPPSTAL